MYNADELDCDQSIQLTNQAEVVDHSEKCDDMFRWWVSHPDWRTNFWILLRIYLEQEASG